MRLIRLSIIIPCYNEERYIGIMLEKVIDVILPSNLEKEIIIINDGSTDKSIQIINSFQEKYSNYNIHLIDNKKNNGKGFCVNQGIQISTGDLILIQDADLEYDPREYCKLIQPIIEGYADIVYTSRFRGDEPRRVMFFYHTLGVWFLTFLSNFFTKLNLTDMHSGYKIFKASIIKNIKLYEVGFGFDTEITAIISRLKGVRIYEVGIAYFGRDYSEGKKIKWIDGIKAIGWILKYNTFIRRL
jgi:glycosyltransferase involved in cell wall biosynthesis